jgi:anti-sigma B factor antagonist
MEMSQPTLTMDVRKASERTSVVDIRGDVTAASEDTLMDAYNRASEDKTKAIVFNFEGLEYMNSSGIGLLVTLLVRAKRQRQSILAYGLNDHYRQIFELTRLDDAIALYDNESDALSAAGVS